MGIARAEVDRQARLSASGFRLPTCQIYRFVLAQHSGTWQKKESQFACAAFRSANPLSRRQKRRMYESRYWHNVLFNTRKWLQRHRERREREEHAVLDYYISVAAAEAAFQPRAAENPSGLVRFYLLFALCFRLPVIFRSRNCQLAQGSFEVAVAPGQNLPRRSPTSASKKFVWWIHCGRTGTKCPTRKMALSLAWQTATYFCSHGRALLFVSSVLLFYSELSNNFQFSISMFLAFPRAFQSLTAKGRNPLARKQLSSCNHPGFLLFFLASRPTQALHYPCRAHRHQS